MGGNLERARGPLPKIPKNDILQDRVNDEQVKLAKAAPEVVKNPKQYDNQERTTLLGA